jgi:hypothetical protein
MSGLGVLALAVTWVTSVFSPPAPSQFGVEYRTARIVTTINGRCQQLVFHNDSTKVSDVESRCTPKDGAPARTAPTGRFDAVSKSFLGRD